MKDILKKAIENASGIKDPNLEFSGRVEFGDYTTNIALTSKINPEELIKKLEKDKNLKEVVEKIELVNPGFINFHLNTKTLTKNLSQILEEKEEYGKSQPQKKQTWLIEHTSPNPNKAMQLGHLRNNVFAMAVSRLWEEIGIKVIRDEVDNNRGIAIAKLMYGYIKYADDVNKKHVRPDRFVDELYVRASKDFEEDPEVEKKVRQIVIDWENGDKETWDLWKKVLSYSYEGQNMTLKRLGNIWDKVWHEHEHYKLGKEIVEEGLKKGIFKKGTGGAIVTDFKKYNLPDTVVIKSDGTALYITQDLALTKLKIKTFHPDHLFWVIGPEQTLAMKQMFAVCEQLGIGKLNMFTHLSYGNVRIKGQGKMSSRKGNVIYIDELLDQAKAEILALHKTEEKIAEDIAVGAVKYSILKISRLQDLDFDFKESLNFEGNSGPYLQYTFARAQSVLAKASITNYEFSNPELKEEELLILRQLVKFPEVIEYSALNYSPNVLCEYLYNLAQKFNGFYNKHKIIDSEAENFRLALTTATGQVLKTGLTLLGIAAPDHM